MGAIYRGDISYGGDNAVWGNITGDISDQEDLQEILDGEIDLLKDTVGWTGKNLIPFPYKNGGAGETWVTNGITFTVNADGSVDVNGTATSTAYFRLGIATEDSNAIWLENGKSYILSGSGNSNVNVWLRNSNNTGVISANVTNATYDCNSSGKYYALLQINSGATISHLVVYPMLRLASINDATYEPYHSSVSEWAYTRSEASILGAKNFVPDNYVTSAFTDGDITVTPLGDGTYSLNGTASTWHDIRLSYFGTSNYDKCIKLPKGTYVLNGTPSELSGGYIYVVSNDGTNRSNVGYDDGTGSGLVFVQSDENVRYEIKIGIVKNTVLQNVVYKPMIRLATDTDSAYQSYAETNHQLTHNKMSYKDNGILGAKNLNSYPYTSNSGVTNGVTWTNNADGTVLANNQASSTSYFNCHNRSTASVNKLIIPNGRYILSGCPSGGSSTTYRVEAGITKNGAYSSLGICYGDEVIINVNGDDNYNDKAQLQIQCIIYNGYTASNLLFKPMIRLASDSDDTWQPYAMTNQELTGKVGTLAPLASPALTGTPTAPTATAGTNTTQIATTAFVQTAIDTAITQVLSASY